MPKNLPLLLLLALNSIKIDGEWEAMIIGDSCLFHKSDSGFKSYPIDNSADFTNRPAFFARFCERTITLSQYLDSGNANPGDAFILATDALAKWILEHKEAGNLDTQHLIDSKR